MAKYYVNNKAQANGDHEVHKDGCLYLPIIVSKEDLGYHNNCFSAVRKAKTIHSKPNGCFHCCNECHTS